MLSIIKRWLLQKETWLKSLGKDPTPIKSPHIGVIYLKERIIFLLNNKNIYFHTVLSIKIQLASGPTSNKTQKVSKGIRK